MSFASPLWLLLLGLMPLIVILHAFSVRWRSTPVSSLVFWNEVLKEKKASIRIRQLLRNLSLVLEVLAAAALALALAGPRVSGRGFSGAGDAILVLDATASMKTREGARTRFDAARAQALDVLSGLRRGARMALITAARYPRLAVPFTEDRDALRRAIGAASSTDEPGDLSESVRLALSLRDARRGDEVFLVTDGAFDSLDGIDTSVPWLHVLTVGTPRDNVGITGLAFRRTLAGPALYEIFVAVGNHGSAPVTAPLTVSGERGVVESRSLRLAPGETGTLSIPWIGPTSGRVEARIKTGDAFPVDDRAFAVFAPARQLRVLVVGAGTYFIRKALESLPGITVRTAEESPGPARAGPGESGAAADDVQVYVGVDAPPLESGNYLFFAALPSDLPIRATGTLQLPPVTGWSRTDPVLHSVSLGGLAIGEALRLEPGPGFTSLASSKDSPLVLSWDHAHLKALIVAFDPARSDLPLRPAFPVLLANALGWFFPSWLSVQADQAQAGTPRALPGSDVGVVVEKPDGTRETIAASSQSSEFLGTSQVGYYRVEAGAGTSEFAVNLASDSESAISPRFVVGAAGQPGEETGVEAAKAGMPTPVWGALAAAALALILAEWLTWLRASRGVRP